MPQRSDDDFSAYSESHVEIISLPEAVRQRPTMYLGSTDRRALHYLLRAVLESLLWQSHELHTPLDQVTIRLEVDGSATIFCQGSPPSKRFLEQRAQSLLCELQPSFRYRPHLMIANACCEQLSVTAWVGSKRWRSVLFKRGILQNDEVHSIPSPETCDIQLHLWPDFTILDPGAFTSEGTHEAIRSFSEDGSIPTLLVVDARDC
ncbi:MAG TPA: hypothetical protein VFV38_19340 [Ktedonobacteraceae bacterium]|nr:hypothetical protein [Ktedonobacteraceae bacterium]